MIITPPTNTKNIDKSTTEAKNLVVPSNRPPSTVRALNVAMSSTREPTKRLIRADKRKNVLIPLVKILRESILSVKE